MQKSESTQMLARLSVGIKALGEGYLAEQIIAELRIKYKRRRLLMEELDQLENEATEGV